MLNKTMLIGNVGADIDLRYTKNQVAMASFRIATTERWKDNEGTVQELTEWHRIVAFGRLAEICSEYLGKGSRVYLEGRLQTRKWQDAEGGSRFTTEVVVREMKMLGNAEKNEAPVLPAEEGQSPPMGDEVPF